MNKKKIAALMAMLMTTSMAVVPVHAEESYKLAFSGSELANPWVAMVKDGFEAACKDNGVEFTSLNAGRRNCQRDHRTDRRCSYSRDRA